MLWKTNVYGEFKVDRDLSLQFTVDLPYYLGAKMSSPHQIGF